MTQQPEDSLQDLPQQKLKTGRLACTGSGRSASSRFAGSLSFTLALEVDKKKGNAVLRRRPSGSARRPSEPSITGARWQPPSPPAPAHLHLPLPPPLALAACQLPSASPLWCSERNFTAAVGLLFAHARPFATAAATHTGMSALG